MDFRFLFKNPEIWDRLYVASLFIMFKVTLKYTNTAIAFIGLFFIALQSTILSVQSAFYMKLLLIPWNNHVSFLVSSIILWFTFGKNEMSKMGCFFLGLALGWVYAARYGDVILFIPIAAYLVTRTTVFNFSTVAKRALIGFIGGILIVIPVIIAEKKWHGGYFTTYHSLGYGNGVSGFFFPFDVSLLTAKLIELFLFPFISTSEGAYWGLFGPTLWIAFSLLGLIKIAYTSKADAFFSSITVILTLYFFTMTGASSALHIKFHCFRYYEPALPFLFFLSFIGIACTAKKIKHRPPNSTKLILDSAVATLTLIGIVFIVKTALNPEFTANIRSLIIGQRSIHLTGTSKESDSIRRIHTIPFRTAGGIPAAFDPISHCYGADGTPDLEFNIEIKSRWPILITGATIINGGHHYAAGYPGIIEDEIISNPSTMSLGLKTSAGKDIYFYPSDALIYGNTLMTGTKSIKLIMPGEVTKFQKYLITLHTLAYKYTIQYPPTE